MSEHTREAEKRATERGQDRRFPFRHGATGERCPAIHIGDQEVPRENGSEWVELWQLIRPVGIYPARSTLSTLTLRRLGYTIPITD